MTNHASRPTSSRLTHHVAIIGGGITGLSTAWYLQQAAARDTLPLRYTVLEKSARWGGKIQTDHVDGYGEQPFVIERAGDAFLTAQKPWAMDLAYELRLDEQILPTNDANRSVYVLKAGELLPIPAGLRLIVPTDREAFLASSLLSDAGKQRMLQEEQIAPRADDADESVAQFVRRRLGDEALDMLAEPLLSGIYNADPAEQSILATFPRFRQLEQQYGSLIGGMQAAMQRAAGDRRLETGDRRRPVSAFISFRDGTETLPSELAARLTGDMRLSTGVERIGWADSGAYVLQLDNGETLRADSVVVTPPARIAGPLLRPLAPAAADQLDQLRTVSTGVIFLAFHSADVQHPLDGFGVVIPRREGRPINAMTWMTTKFAHRAPEGYVLLRIFFGGVRTPQTMQLEDDDVLAVARAELRDLMGIDAQPVFHRVYRWWNAQPQYDVSHLERMDAIDAALPARVYIAGSPYRGVGIPDCVRQGKEASQRIVARMARMGG